MYIHNIYIPNENNRWDPWFIYYDMINVLTILSLSSVFNIWRLHQMFQVWRSCRLQRERHSGVPPLKDHRLWHKVRFHKQVTMRSGFWNLLWKSLNNWKQMLVKVEKDESSTGCCLEFKDRTFHNLVQA